MDVKGSKIDVVRVNGYEYISLTDLAKTQNDEAPADVVKNWLRNKETLSFLGVWEELNNENFKVVEFDQFKNQAGRHAFTMSPQKWIRETNAIGIISKSGKYGGGTFARSDIAFEFASWISPEFKLYLIKEFERLKQLENQNRECDVKRILLSNLESHNAELIREGKSKEERFEILSGIAEYQLNILNNAERVKLLGEKDNI